MSEPCTVKACVACGKILNGQKRMKDSHGRHWCVECGKHDQQRKPKAVAVPSAACDGCRQTFPVHQLSKSHGKSYCIACSHAHATTGLLHAPISEVLTRPRRAAHGRNHLMQLLALAGLLAAIVWRFH